MTNSIQWRTIIGSPIEERDGSSTIFEVEGVGRVLVHDRNHEKAIDFGLNPTVELEEAKDVTHESGGVVYKIASFS